MSDTQEAFGRPIEGEIPRYSEGQAEQYAPELFLEALDNLLSHPSVRFVEWRQYTPYFNDGDPCTFSAYLCGINTVDAEYEDDVNIESSYRMEDKELAKLYDAFDSAVGGGHHDSLLCDKFGDPSRVVATKEGFTVDEYSHD